MSHVAPHRWAELARGTLGDREQQRMLDHADGCAACARARDRVTGAARAFADLARTPAPELGWDTIRARVYWATSSERRERERTQRMHAVRLRRWGFVAIPAIAAAAAAVIMLAERGGSSSESKTPAAPIASTGSGVPGQHPIAKAPAPLTGVVTLVQGGATVDGAATAATVMAHPIAAGSSLATTDGRVAVQFGDGSVFALGARSSLRVNRFDAGGIELALGDAGDVTIEVAPRAPGQRFTVVAGDRTIEVRGTAFHVVRRGDTIDVACSHGLVAVRDRAGNDLLVPAGQGVVVADAESLADRAARPLDEAALAALAHAIGPRLPVWVDDGSLYRTSAPLAIAAPRRRAVAVDGVAVGDGALVVRVMSGRHLVEAATADGTRFSSSGAGQWIDAGPGRADGRIDARADVGATIATAPAASPAAARAARQAELEHGLDHTRADACLRSLAKQGVASGTHVSLEISVDASGAIGMLNVGDTDLPARVASCVRDVVATVRFPKGAAATFTQRLDF